MMYQLKGSLSNNTFSTKSDNRNHLERVAKFFTILGYTCTISLLEPSLL